MSNTDKDKSKFVTYVVKFISLMERFRAKFYL